MDFITTNQAYTTEQLSALLANLQRLVTKLNDEAELNAMRTDLQKLMAQVNDELTKRQHARFDKLVKNVVTALDALTNEFPTWTTHYDTIFCGELWRCDHMTEDDFYLDV